MDRRRLGHPPRRSTRAGRGEHESRPSAALPAVQRGGRRRRRADGRRTARLGAREHGQAVVPDHQRRHGGGPSQSRRVAADASGPDRDRHRRLADAGRHPRPPARSPDVARADRVQRPDADRSGPGSFPVSPRRLRSRLGGRRGRAPGLVHQPAPRPLPVPRARQRRRRRLARPGRASGTSASSRSSIRRQWFQALCVLRGLAAGVRVVAGARAPGPPPVRAGARRADPHEPRHPRHAAPGTGGVLPCRSTTCRTRWRRRRRRRATARVRIRRQVEDSIREARHSIWDLRSPMLVSRDLPRALREAGERVIAGRPVELDVKVSGAARTIGSARGRTASAHRPGGAQQRGPPRTRHHRDGRARLPRR